MILSRVVLPEPLSPRMARNSPAATSREMSRRTGCRPKDFATFRMLSRHEFEACWGEGARASTATTAFDLSGLSMPMKFTAACPIGHSVAGEGARATLSWLPHGLLRCFYFVPDFVVLSAARNILPEINALLVLVDVIEVQVLLLLG